MTSEANADSLACSDKSRYQEGEKVLSYHGPLLYEAKIIKSERRKIMGNDHVFYFIHYLGWSKNWDEWVPEERVVRINEAGLALQQALRNDIIGVGNNQASKDKKVDKEMKKSRKEKFNARGKDKSEESMKKQKMSEDDPVMRHEIKLLLAVPLKKQLVDDWEHITRSKKLVPLPRKITVADILAEFAATKSLKKGIPEQVVIDVAEGLQVYFDQALGSLLLYRFERAQYNQTMADHKNKRASEIYGAEHLLRLLVKLPELLSLTNMTSTQKAILESKCLEFVKFFQRGASRYFLSSAEYADAPMEYVEQWSASIA